MLTLFYFSCSTNSPLPEEKAEVMKSIMAACDSLELGYKQSQQESSAPYSALSMLQAGEEEMEAY